MVRYDYSKLTEIRKGQTGFGILKENDGYLYLSEESRKKVNESAREGESGAVPNPFIVDAVLQKYDTKNANRRVYPKDILVREAEKYISKIEEQTSLGECNHPDDTTINLSRVSHSIVEMHWEGKTLVGKLKLNLTPGYVKYGIVSSEGDNIANLILNGFKVGVSSRGVGNVENKMGIDYVTDYELLCWDVVSDPSTPGSWISTEKENLTPYIESRVNTEKNTLDWKINRIKSLLK